MTKWVLAGIVVFASAAAAASGRVQVLGPDTYSLSTAAQRSIRSQNAARKSGLDEATRYCAQHSKAILVTNIETKPVGANFSVDIAFRCLPKGDPELRRRRRPGAVQ